MSKKVILSEENKVEIINFILNYPQCTINDVVKEFNISRHVIVNNFDKEYLNSILFHGCKDSTKLKLREANLGKTESQETKDKISNSVKETFKNKPKEEKTEAYYKGVQTKIINFGSWEAYAEYVDKKSKETKLARYDDENYNNPDKGKATKLERYGDENYNNFEQICATKLERYNDPYYYDKEKYKETMMSLYNVPHNWSSDDPKLNGRSTCYEEFGGKDNFYKHTIEKGKQTRFVLYGDEFYSNTEQAQATMLKKYGVPFYTMTDDCQNKSRTPESQNKKVETRKKNKTFNTSSSEIELKNILINYYGESDVVEEYQDPRYSNSKGYMFKCDFYIKSKDIFIELNYHPTHGLHPFDETNKEDLNSLNILRLNDTKWNRNVINVWTERDVEKLASAKSAKLNYITIYPGTSCDEVIDIIENGNWR